MLVHYNTILEQQVKRWAHYLAKPRHKHYTRIHKIVSAVIPRNYAVDRMEYALHGIDNVLTYLIIQKLADEYPCSFKRFQKYQKMPIEYDINQGDFVYTHTKSMKPTKTAEPMNVTCAELLKQFYRAVTK